MGKTPDSGIGIWIFSGTTEGRELSLWAAERGFFVTVGVASAYGGEVMPAHERIAVREGRLSAKEMAEALTSAGVRLAVDATHPFATAVSAEIREACAAIGLPCLRLRRRTKDAPAAAGNDADGPRFFSAVAEAAAFLAGRSGDVFVTTGSKELPALVRALGGGERLTVRVLPQTEALGICAECGIPGARIIAMQGPFSEEMNRAMFGASKAKFLLTKESGAAGGYAEKLAAAEALGMEVCVLRNPEQAETDGCAGELSAEEPAVYGAMAIREEILRRFPLRIPVRRLLLIGTGPGDPALLTGEAVRALRSADVIFGAESVLQRAVSGAAKGETTDGRTLFRADAEKVAVYRPADVYDWLDAHPACDRPAVLFSGDVGFYSGAALFYRERRDGFLLRALPGISSVQVLAARLGIALAPLPIVSCHGRDGDPVAVLRAAGRCLLFVSGASDLPEIGDRLRGACENGVLCPVVVSVCRNLSLPDEEICRELAPKALMTRDWPDGNYLLYLEERADKKGEPAAGDALTDEAFLRGERTPMTKENIRALVLRRLNLPENAVFWDIGAGTGSVSVEAARRLARGTVVAVERDEGALAVLQRNVTRFCVRNVRIAAGEATEMIRRRAGTEDGEMPVPTHAFIGGSGGKLSEIVRLLLSLNPRIRIVLTAVTTETQTAAQTLISSLPIANVRQTLVQIAEVKGSGSAHLMRAENPIWLISFDGAPAEDPGDAAEETP